MNLADKTLSLLGHGTDQADVQQLLKDLGCKLEHGYYPYPTMTLHAKNGLWIELYSAEEFVQRLEIEPLSPGPWVLGAVTLGLKGKRFKKTFDAPILTGLQLEMTPAMCREVLGEPVLVSYYDGGALPTRVMGWRTGLAYVGVEFPSVSADDVCCEISIGLYGLGACMGETWEWGIFDMPEIEISAAEASPIALDAVTQKALAWLQGVEDEHLLGGVDLEVVSPSPFDASSWFEDRLDEYRQHLFIQFAADGSGSGFCLWYYPTLTGQPPVVFWGSEGDFHFVAGNAQDFMRQLSSEHVFSNGFWLEDSGDEDFHDEDFNWEPLKAAAKAEFGQTDIVPDELGQAGRSLHPDFEAWVGPH